MEKLKNNKILIIVIIVIVAIALIFMFGGNKGGGSVNKNETLKINEYDESVSFKLNKLDDVTYFSGFYEDEKIPYTGVNLSITNNGNKSVNILTYSFALLDSNGNELAHVNAGMQDFEVENSVNKNQLLQTDIAAKQTTNGYLYFKTDSTDIKKIRIACPTKNKTANKSVVAGQETYFQYYYINI